MANATRVWEERPELPPNVQAVREQVEEACARAGRPPESVRIIAVAKFHPASAVQAALAAGLTDIGENRVQEAREKAEQIPHAVWHMVGRLQTNKAAQAAELFSWIHSVDRIELAAALGRAAARRRSTPLQVLVQVNLAGELQKGGCPAQAVPEVLAALKDYPMLAPRGLMIVPPEGQSPRPEFQALRELLSRMRDRFPDLALDQLSMGMSGDFAEAIAEGATMVRIGTAIFGSRQGG
ncbi:MAG: YggS family pyridoxal phosphate-dependent enzyme [Thermaerobacter sp.]|nr:YggS family pyridoxal phosphate-dependent enzyme [Thermaerobacter sp.]